MPYIRDKKRRAEMDLIVELMDQYKVEANGDLNYILFKYCKYHVPSSYRSLKNFLGELTETASEVRRRILGPYEDKAIEENGDV